MTREELLSALKRIDQRVTIEPETPPPDEEAGFVFIQCGSANTLANYYTDANGKCAFEDEQLDVLVDWLKGVTAADPRESAERPDSPS